MATIVSTAEGGKPARERLGAVADDIVSQTGHDPARRAELREELWDHLVEAYEGELLRGTPAADAVARALNCFGNSRAIARRIWWTRVVEDLRMSWRLPLPATLFILADLVGATIWIGVDMASAPRSAFWHTSLLTLFAGAFAIVYWVSFVLGRAGLVAIRRTVRNGAPRIEALFGAGLLGSALAVFFQLRPGAIANAVGSRMERVHIWLAMWEWAGAVSVSMVAAGFAALVWRALDVRQTQHKRW